ncbi:MAG: pilus assembly protein PilN [Gammaproteobacteria bacterium]|uniref:Pilus assembly protein PilN n=1 Tax=Thiolapillus brandeum TaxID=1076588 RepID=A0A831JRP2_9GAMM|nr:MAG: pilus assembly protein PilN [Gammaproteobacteria bacterium]HDK38082.1 pilus assembly protein PilN [Thiolapillus brandeum]
MARINLLPWREELRKQKQQEFGVTAISSAVIAGLIVLLAHFHVDGLINNQDQRNVYLEGEIDILNERIGRIRELEAMKDNLLARMNVIQELQGSRPESVHLMDELVRTLPEGVHLVTFQQKNKALAMKGIAESNARVSDYMRQIDSSDWITSPRLDVIKTSEAKRRRIANFTMHGNQKPRKPIDDSVKAAP